MPLTWASYTMVLSQGTSGFWCRPQVKAGSITRERRV